MQGIAQQGHIVVDTPDARHEAGDLLLKYVAERLVNCVRKGDFVGRFGGEVVFVLNLNVPATVEDNGPSSQWADSNLYE